MGDWSENCGQPRLKGLRLKDLLEIFELSSVGYLSSEELSGILF